MASSAGQRASLGAALLATLRLISAAGTSGDITADIRDSSVSGSIGQTGQQTNVFPGITYWTSGFSTHNWYGNVYNRGTIVCSQTDYAGNPGGQTVDYVGTSNQLNGVLNNTGTILLNDASANSAPTYDWTLWTYSNYGTMQWCGRGDTGGSTYHLRSYSNSYNYGLILFEQVLGQLGTAMTWQSSTTTSSNLVSTNDVYNYGGFMMRSARVDFVQSIKGAGCFMIDTNAIMYLEDGVYASNNYGNPPVLSGHSIKFTGTNGVLHLDNANYIYNRAFGATIYGFGQGQWIEVLQTITSVTYTPLTGILTLNIQRGLYFLDLNIGLGYDPTLFSITRNPIFYNTAGNPAVIYSGSAPAQSPPAQCQLTASVCQALGTAATTTQGYSGSTTTTTTIFNGGRTVVVQTPTAFFGTYTTVYSTYSGSVYQTTTLSASFGQAQGTVVVNLPSPTYTTQYVGYAGTTTSLSTVSATQGALVATVIAATPTNYNGPYTTQFTTGPVPGTSTLPQTRGAAVATVIVTLPSVVYTTVTSGYSGSTVAFSTQSATLGASVGTVVALQPTQFFGPYTTVFSQNPAVAPGTTTLPATAGQGQGTVVVNLPPVQYTTVNSGYGGTTVALTTVSPTLGASVATVIQLTPTNFNGPYTTVFSQNPSVAPGTTTLPATAGQAQGTVVVNLGPVQYTTVNSGYGGTTVALTTISPTLGASVATVVQLTPTNFNGPYTTIFSQNPSASPGTVTLPATAGQPQGTVVVNLPPVQYTTVNSGYAGTTALLSTVSPTLGASVGTVIQYTPTAGPPQTTIFSQNPSVSPGTVTLPATQGAPLQTVIVNLPPVQYTTVQSGYAGTTVALTTVSPTLGASIATVIELTPTGGPPQTTIFSQNPSVLPGTVTLTATQGAALETVIVNLPPVQYTTVQSGYSGATAVLSTVSPTLGASVATVIQFTPTTFTGPYTTQYSTGTGTDYQTTTLPASAGASQGVVVVVLPTVAYSTQFSGYSGTVPSTTTISPTQGARIGTVIVLTPTAGPSYFTGPYTTQFTTGSGSVYSTSTLSVPSGASLGTVVVVLPTVAYTTQFSGYGGLVATTTTISPTQGAQVGTVVVLTPTNTSPTTTTGQRTVTVCLNIPSTTTV